MTNGTRRWTGRSWPHERGASSWSSGLIATVVTLGVFVTAFIAMATVRGLRLTEPHSRDAVAVVHLTPPNERFEPPKPPTPARVRTPARPMPHVAPPVPPSKASTDSVTGVPPGAPTGAPPVVSPTTAPVTVPTTGAGRDSGGGARSPGASILGAPYAPIERRIPLTPAQRDSFQKGMLARISAEEWHRPLTPTELADLRARREPGLDPHGRAARLPGEPVYAPLMNGGYAVAAPLVSVPLPFGKSRAQRKADSIITADGLARLARLQDRVKHQREIAKADSLRRDSLIRVSRRP